MGERESRLSEMKRQPLLKVQYRDPIDGWEGILVIDSLVDGLCAGGVRVSRTVDENEAMRLARAMTLKMRSLGLPLGGAKVGIRYNPRSDDFQQAVTRFFQHVKPICAEMYGFGPDMNTSAAGLDQVARDIGMPTRHQALTRKRPDGMDAVKRYHEVLDKSYGPMIVQDARNGAGVAASVERTARITGLEGTLRVAVQGFGQVGGSTAWFLQRSGHTVVGIADGNGYYRSRNGLDVEALISKRAPDRTIDVSQLPGGVDILDRESVLEEDCDVLVLAAVADAVTHDTASKVRAKIVVEGGNLAVSEAASLLLHSKDVIVVPDFLASGGAISVVAGVICMGWNTDPLEDFIQHVGNHIGDAVERAVISAREKGLTVRQAAMLELGSDF